jgi:signal transduction histidine kinase
MSNLELTPFDIIDSLIYSAAVLDSNGAIIAVNESWRRFARENGRSASASDIGMNYLKECANLAGADAKGADAAFRGISAVLQGKKDKFTLEYARHAAGAKRWFILNASKLRGASAGAVVLHIEITEQKETEAALRENARRFYSILAAMHYGVLLVSREGKIEFANQALCDLFALSSPPSDLPGLPSTAMLEKIRVAYQDPEGAGARILELIERAQPVNDEEVAMRNGRTYLRGFVPLKIEGKQAGRLWQVQDITERKRLETDLRVAIAARDEFLSIASHELKTPLTAIQLLIQNQERLLRSAGPAALPYERLARGSEIILKEIKRLAVLIDDLLDVSRISAGRLSLNREVIDLHSLIKEVLAREEMQLIKARMPLEEDLQENVLIAIDRLRIDQVLTNLLSNAIKYAPGKPLRVGLAAEGGVARIEVRDQGPGISKGDQDKLFTRFERAAASATAVSGLGLGLFISKQIVEAHHGKIKINSEPGSGASFVVTLPLRLEKWIL